MALIKCKECNHQISSQAKTCPNCGCPIRSEDIESTKSALGGCLKLVIGFVLIIFLIGLFNKSEPVKSQKLDITLPIYTQQISDNWGAMVCPSSLLYDLRVGHGAQALFDAKASISDHQKKIADVGCEEIKGGLQVYIEPDELKRIQTIQASDKAGLISFGFGVNIYTGEIFNIGKVIYSGDLTNNPSGKYGEPYAPSVKSATSNYQNVISDDEQKDLHKDTIFKILNRPSIDSCPEKIIIKNKYSHQYIFNKDGQLGIVFWSNRIPELVYENINFKRDIVDQGFDPRTYKIDNEPVCIANKVFTIESFGDYAKCDSNLSCETYIKANVPQNWYINNEKMMTLENMKKQVIKDFYTLLSKGDITTAEDFLVFEKRNKGTFEINKMKAFYEHMKQPINLISV